MATYTKGSELPDLAETWTDDTGAVIDFSAGWTFGLKVASFGDDTAAFTKTTGITGAATAPNVTVAWATTGELNSLAPGVYRLQITATRSADGKERVLEDTIHIRARIT